MADGGVFPWRRQVIDEHRGPATNYKGIRAPLPVPPKNMSWMQDAETREWRLVECDAAGVVEVKATVLNDGTTTCTVGYVEHKIEPSDTFQGVCLRYKITPTELRRANCFSGSNLSMARNPLRIPTTGSSIGAAPIAVAVPIQNDTASRDSNIRTVMKSACISRAEAICFLDLHDWDVTQAVADARSDYTVDNKIELTTTKC